jgi:hypothetical protein
MFNRFSLDEFHRIVRVASARTAACLRHAMTRAEMTEHKVLYSNERPVQRGIPLRGTAVATAATLFGIALFSCPANAQATYTYTGNPYTLTTGSYTASQRVTATLQLSAWLPPKSDCVDVTQLPGFRLIMDDGLQTLDSANLPATGYNQVYTAVSTNATGQIATRWILLMTQFQSGVVFREIDSLVSPTVPATCGPLTLNAEVDEADLAEFSPFNSSDSNVVNNPGVWSYPSPANLTAMLLNQIQLGVLPDIGGSLSTQLTAIATDIGKGNGQACQDLRSLVNHISAQTEKKVAPAQSNFILTALAIVQSSLQCTK